MAATDLKSLGGLLKRRYEKGKGWVMRRYKKQKAEAEAKKPADGRGYLTGDWTKARWDAHLAKNSMKKKKKDNPGHGY